MLKAYAMCLVKLGGAAAAARGTAAPSTRQLRTTARHSIVARSTAVTASPSPAPPPPPFTSQVTQWLARVGSAASGAPPAGAAALLARLAGANRPVVLLPPLAAAAAAAAAVSATAASRHAQTSQPEAAAKPCDPLLVYAQLGACGGADRRTTTAAAAADASWGSVMLSYARMFSTTDALHATAAGISSSRDGTSSALRALASLSAPPSATEAVRQQQRLTPTTEEALSLSAAAAAL